MDDPKTVEFFETILQTIDSAEKSGDRKMEFCRVHGLGGNPQRPDPPDCARRFRDRAYECFRDANWNVKTIIRVENPSVLASVEAHIEKFTDARGYEIKAVVGRDALPLMSPLIVGEDSAFLGLDDESCSYVIDGIHLTGPKAHLVSAYWDQLWRQSLYTIREPGAKRQEGLNALRQALCGPSPSNPVFVAMWFGVKTKRKDGDMTEAEMQHIYEQGIAPAVTDAGYRVTKANEVHFNDAIMDRVFGDIRAAPFVVADFTGQRNGVYLEAGFGRGLGRPVIHTCAESNRTSLHFDTKHLNHIFWKDAADLREKLFQRIRGSIGLGPHPVGPP